MALFCPFFYSGNQYNLDLFLDLQSKIHVNKEKWEN